MEFTGERFCPHVSGEIALEHYLRYLMAASLAKGKDVLDIACGEGYGSNLLASTADSVVGVDISKEVIVHATATYSASNLRFQQGNAADIPLPDASVDLVVSFETIEHHNRHEDMLREIRRVLRPDGVLCLSSPDRSVNADIWGYSPHHVKELNKKELEELISRYFTCYAIFGQKTVFASLVMREKTEKLRSWHLDDLKTPILPEGMTGIPYPKFHVVLATNGAALPDLPSGLLEGSALQAECAQKALQEETAPLRNEVQALREKIPPLQETISAQRQTILALEGTAAERMDIIKAMASSRSWKCTAPLRRIGELVHQWTEKCETSCLRLKTHIKALMTSAGQKFGASVTHPPFIVLLSGEHDTPGHIYRMERLAAALRPRYRVALIPVEKAAQRHALIRTADILWIWRAAYSAFLHEMITEVKKAGGHILFDVDDLCFHPSFYAPELMDAIRHQQLEPDSLRKYGQAIFRLLELSDICVVTTEPLARAVRDLTYKPVIVIPNTFDREFYLRAAHARSRILEEKNDALVRIGYAAGTLTHQADLRLAAPALAAVMAEHPETRLVLFRPMVDLNEIEELAVVSGQIEWRDAVPLRDLPDEIARFDINIAPLEVENAFCHCKSELKFFEAALAGVPSVASATPPMRQAMRHGETGFLAEGPEDWKRLLETLVSDRELRERMGRNARRDVLWSFGPEKRARLVFSLVESLRTSPDTRAFSFVVNDVVCSKLPLQADVPEYEVDFSTGPALNQVSVVIPLYNYEKYIPEALESLRSQSMQHFDVIVVDDASTDDSANVARNWLIKHKPRFSSVSLLRNRKNSGLSLTRNAGIDYSHSEYVMLLDADNMLLPDCLKLCAEALDTSSAAVAYPEIEIFGEEQGKLSWKDWDPFCFRYDNYVDAMAMLRKACWSALGGYAKQDLGWEDYDFWCKMIEHGFWGRRIPVVAARYRHHASSMLRTVTEVKDSRKHLASSMNKRHDWLRL